MLSPTGHDLSALDVDAVRAVTRLIDKGYEAYLVGGCVRDLLLDRTPKDYDIATEARPAQVKRTFSRNCRIIGRRFKLAHLHFHRNTKILECSTFRRNPQPGEGDSDEDLLITRDNEFGTAEEDALRRDFTVNALFLDPTEDQIVDHVNGLADIEARVIRTIGDPVVRFREDPVRILRAAKFAGRLGFDVEEKTLAAMAETSEDLVRAAPPRVLEEILRLLRSGHASDSFRLLDEVRAIEHLVPVVGRFLADADDERVDAFWALLRALDAHIQDQPAGAEPPPNGVLLAALVYEAVAAERARTPKRSASSIAEDLLGSLATDLRLPRRDSGCLKRACGVQHRFAQAEDKRRFRAESFVHGPYFEESLMLFTLRTVAEDGDPEAAASWRALAEAEGVSAVAGADDAPEDSDEQPTKKRRRRRRRRRDDDEDREDDRDVEAPSGEASSDDVPPARARRSRRRAPVNEGATGEDLSDVTFPSGADDDDSHAGDQSDAPDDGDDALVDEPEEITLSNVTLDDVTFDDDEQDDDEAPRKRRRRRGRRGRGRSKNGGDDATDEASAEDATESKGERPRRSRGKDRQKDGAKDGRSRRDGKRGEQRKKRAKKSRGGVRSDVGVVPRHRDRRGKVEVIEPVAQDLSAFDVELDPKRVPTFGSIVEGKPRPKRRGPRLTNKGTDDYRPPPPPGSDAPPSSPPPAPRSDDDTFGDW
ncbi:MAG: polynucleotide adenylyltransferase PcnB [Planctomycetota bacterium]|nr:polynucleotide adenylyltransferase PcnB [Planctomycetota bacterium]